jgi:hypothetical protein
MTRDALEDMDLDDLYEGGGLRTVHFGNANQFSFVRAHVEATPRWPGCAPLVFGRVTPLADPSPARVMPSGYPLRQICYQVCAAMQRETQRDPHLMRLVLSRTVPDWKLGDMAMQRAIQHAGTQP